MNSQTALSIVHGPPLADEAGLGALTLPGFLREVCERHPVREALVEHRPGGTMLRWSYAELWSHAMAVAKALTAGEADPEHGGKKFGAIGHQHRDALTLGQPAGSERAGDSHRLLP